jgi:hypothetical protein
VKEPSARAIIHRISTPENESEARTIRQLTKDLPDDCFVFHTFEVATVSEAATDYR